MELWPSAPRKPAWPAAAYRRLVVPLTAEVESETAMELAAELAADHGATITAVVVIEVPPQLPLDAHMLDEEDEARRVLEEARAIGSGEASRADARSCAPVRRARRSSREAAAGGADVVVLRAPRAGAGRRSSARRSTYVLKHAPCRVLVAARLLRMRDADARPIRRCSREPPPRRADRLAWTARRREAAADRPAARPGRARRHAAPEDAGAADLLVRPDLVGRLRDGGRPGGPRRRARWRHGTTSCRSRSRSPPCS